ncbi:MAG TPA: HEAT repeat domain-containing protein [Pirellulales bacterium]
MPSRAAYWALLINLCGWAVGCGADPDGQSIAQLQSADVEARRAAARALAQNGHSENRVIVALTKAAADRDAEVKSLAIGALGRIGKSAASSLPALTANLQDPQPAVRLSAALAIQKIEPKSSAFVPVLIGAMRAGDGHVLLDVGAMGKDGAWAVPTLIELLAHPLPQVRALAAQTLGRIGPPAAAAKPALQRATHDSNPAVGQAAHRAIERIQNESAGATNYVTPSTSKVAFLDDLVF